MAGWSEADIADLEAASSATQAPPVEPQAHPISIAKPVKEPSSEQMEDMGIADRVRAVPGGEAMLAAREDIPSIGAPPPAVVAPAEDSAAFNIADVASLEEASGEQDNEVLRNAFRHGLQEAPDQQAGVISLARELNANPSVVEKNYPTLKASWEASKFDADAWKKENPGLAKMALEDPRVGRLVVHDPELSVVSKALNKLSDFDRSWYDWQRGWLEPLWPSAYSDEAKNSKDRGRLDTIRGEGKPQTQVEDAKTAVFNEMSPLERTLVGPAIRFEQSQQQMNISKQYWQLLTARQLGKAPAETYGLEKEILSAEQNAIPYALHETPMGGLLGDSAEAVSSQFAIFGPAAKGVGIGAAVGATVFGVGGGLLFGPEAIASSAKQGAKLGARVGGKVGLAAGSLQLEAGGAYASLLRATRDDGQHLSEAEARGGALIYGAMAAGIELGFTEQLLKSAGPLGEALLGNAGKETLAQLLVKDVGFRKIAQSVGIAYAKGAAGEAVEEFSQQAVNQVVDYLTLSKSQGKFQTLPTVGEAAVEPLLAGQKGGIGGLALAGPGAVVNLSSRLQSQAVAERNGALVKQLAKLPENSATTAAAPEAVARMVTEAFAENGESVKSVHVDAKAFATLFQSENADASEAATQLLGENGPLLLQQALATGGRLEVPLADYLSKWGGAEVAERLSGDTAIQATGLTLNEKAAQQQEIEAGAKRIAKQFENETVEPAGEEGTYVDALEQQLLATKTMKPDAAKKLINIHRAFIRSMSEVFGIPAEALFRDFAVTVQRGGDAAPSVPTAYNAQRVLEQRANTLTPEERSAESYVDAGTGALNRRAFEAMATPDKPLVAHISVEGIKFINDNASHDKGDLLYRAAARALFAVNPDIAKVDGDFALHVSSQAELDALLSTAQQTMPEGFQLTGTVGPSFKEAGQAHNQVKDAAVAAGTRAARGAQPIGFKGDAKALTLPEEKVAAKVPAHLTERVAKLSPEDYFNERYRDQVTGAWTSEGWNALPRRRHVIAFDLKGLKRANADFGEELGDAMIRAFANSAGLSGGEFFDFAHLHGDEYAAQTGDLEAAKRFISRLQQVVARNPVEYFEKETETYTPHNVGFRFGLGKWTYEAADEDLNARKKLESAKPDASLEFGGEAQGAVDVQRGGRTGPQAESSATEGSDPLGSGEAGQRESDDAELNSGLDEARAFVARMRSKEKQSMAAAWLAYAANPALPRPTITDELEKDLARFGVVDPVHGFNFSEDGRSLERAIGGRKSFGKEPEELRRQRLASLAFRTYGDMRGRYEQAAYHGSPHRFERFSLEHLGTGEGAQVYGWGLYFASKMGIAEWYRQTLSKPKRTLMVDGKEITKDSHGAWKHGLARLISADMVNNNYSRDEALEHAHTAAYRDAKEAEKAIKEIEESSASAAAKEKALVFARQDLKDAQEAKEWVVSLRDNPERVTAGGAGQLYEVDVPETHELLDYDAPLAEQPKAVRDAVEALPQEAKDYFKAKGVEDLNSMTGEALYRGLVSLARKTRLSESKVSGPEEDASRFLLEHGIPGLRYLDAASRDGTDRSHNFVIWDDSRVDVKRTFYQPERLNAGEPSNPRGYMEMAEKGYQRLFRIALNPTADMSTFLHESGHVFLELFGELADRPDAPARAKEDYAKALKHIGAKSREDIQTEHHEKFARSFEAYFYEGKSPSPDLVPVFERMRLWLKQVYRSITALDAPLSPDIRGVFDRMLKAEQVESSVSSDMGLQPMFQSPEDAGMTPEQWQEYLKAQLEARSTGQRKLELRMLKDKLRENEQWWKEAEKEERAKATEEYSSLPASRAFAYLRGGDFLLVGEDGDTEKGSSTKMDPTRVAYELGKTPPEKLNGVMKKGGLEPSAVAEALGFDTGRQMLEAMVAHPELADYVSERTNERMLERYPDIQQDTQALRELVAKGLHGDHTASWLLKEWQAIGHRMRFDPETGRHFDAQGFTNRLPPIEAIQRAARLLAEKATVRRLDAGRALQAERNAAVNAAKAAARGNWEQAALYKQQQLLNFYLNRQLNEARELRDSFEELASKAQDPKWRAKLGKANPIYRDGVDLILEALTLKEEEANREKPLASLGQVVTQMEADQGTILFDRDVLEQIVAKRTSFQSLTVAQLREVSAAVKNIRAVANSVSTALIDGKREDKEAVVAELVAEAAANLPALGPAKTESAKNDMEKVGGFFSALDGSLLRPETMLLWLGGEKGIHSKWFRAFMAPLQQAKAKEVDLLNLTAKPVLEAFEHMPKEVQARMQDGIDAKALFPNHREDLQVSKRFEVLMMALYMGNASNIERLTEGRGITEKEVLNAINTVLTKQEMDWVQSVWDANESLWPLARDLEERDSGLAPPKLPPKPVATAHGTYAGGYMPAIYVKDVEAVGQRQALGGLSALMDPGFTRPSTAKSHLKSRVEGFTGAISLEPSAIPSHLAQVVHDLAYREALKSVGGLLLSPKVQAALRERLGTDRRDQLLTWIKDVGQMRGLAGTEHASRFLKAARAVRANTVVSALGFAVPNMLEDMSNLVAVIPRTDLKSKHLAAAMGDFLTSPMESARIAHEKSGELRTRREQLQRELQAQVKAITSKGVLQARPLRWIRKHAFALMEASDWATSTPIWMGAYRQAKMGGENEADAVMKADLTVRQVFASHSPVDQAAILRDKGYIGASLMFYGFLNNSYNALRDISHELHTAEDAKDVASRVPRVAGRAIGYLIATAVLSEFLRGRGREPDEEWSQWFLRKMLAGSLATVPFGGDMANYLEAKVMKKQSNPRNSSLVGVATSVGDAVAKLAHEYGDDGGDEQAKRWIGLLKSLGPVVGLPVAQPGRSAQYLYDIMTGKREVHGPGDVLSGVIFGEKDAQPATPFRRVRE